MQIKHIFVALDGHHGGPDRATLRMRRLWVENFGVPLEVGKKCPLCFSNCKLTSTEGKEPHQAADEVRCFRQHLSIFVETFWPKQGTLNYHLGSKS